ncbi:uncharacterized protein LOC129697562 [Leucoraja erinacea]|uniref:uncharacterized protein LOC129697562 n=1 Tax=Leucoraja erinaceus TaxID=7782 RepID=UPI0024589FF4|nr:uncharacterized protein LOC129697562 [Leucoraja erinacea]XP_055492207.1 uncharacterized protein LOC129697562 [Leucoraja erinacea]
MINNRAGDGGTWVICRSSSPVTRNKYDGPHRPIGWSTCGSADVCRDRSAIHTPGCNAGSGDWWWLVVVEPPFSLSPYDAVTLSLRHGVFPFHDVQLLPARISSRSACPVLEIFSREIMTLKPQEPTHLLKFPFKIATEKFKYLGIQITRKYKALFNANFIPLLNKLNTLIEFWKTLPLSLLGRINAIKMIFLLQLLYLFQSIPVYIPKYIYFKLDSNITNYIWDYRSHRITNKHLCKPKEVGGLSLPNFMYYYWAVHFKNMIYWLDSSTQQREWIKMEKEDCHPCNIGTILFSPKKLNNTIYKKNPIIYGTIRIWKQIKLYLKLRNLSLLMPIANNPLFKPSLIDKTYNQWESLGIRRIGDMYEMGNLLSFQQLQLKFKLKNKQYFKYLQICDLKKYIQGYQKITSEVLEEAMNIETDSQKLISYLYNSILNIDLPSTEVLRE